MSKTPKPENLDSETKNEEVDYPTNKAYSVKKLKEGSYAVVSKTGEVVRTYQEEEGCEDPKSSAIMYAKKLSAKNQ